MAWSTPITAVANATFTSAQYNASDRDNMLLTPAALATTAGWHFVSTGANSVAERAIVGAAVDTQETTTSVSYIDLATAGPTTGALTTGTKALVWISAQLSNAAANQSYMSYGVSGATTTAPSDVSAVVNDQPAGGGLPKYGLCDLAVLTAGSNTFYTKYRVTASTGTFLRRHMQVMCL